MDSVELAYKNIQIIENGLSGKVSPIDLVNQLEDFIDSPEMYDELYEVNPKLGALIADDIFDITEPMEPGMDTSDFFLKLKEHKEKIIATINE